MRKSIGGMFVSGPTVTRISWRQRRGDLFGFAFLILYFDFLTIAEVCSIDIDSRLVRWDPNIPGYLETPRNSLIDRADRPAALQAPSNSSSRPLNNGAHGAHKAQRVFQMNQITIAVVGTNTRLGRNHELACLIQWLF